MLRFVLASLALVFGACAPVAADESVVITSPADGAYVQKGAPISVSANWYDAANAGYYFSVNIIRVWPSPTEAVASDSFEIYARNGFHVFGPFGLPDEVARYEVRVDVWDPETLGAVASASVYIWAVDVP